MEYEKTAESTSDLTGNKTADKITKNLQELNSERITNEYDKIYNQKKYRKLLMI